MEFKDSSSVHLQVRQILAGYPNFSLVESEDGYQRWKKMEEQVELLPIQYQKELVDYQKLYFKERTDYVEEISMLLKSGSKDIGIWPVFLIHMNGQWKCSTCGGEVMEPLFDKNFNLTVKTKRKIYKAALQLIMDLSKELHITRLDFTETLVDGNVSLWHRFLMENGACIYKVTHMAYYDVMLDKQRAMKMMHRTTAQQIKKGYEFYRYEIITANSKDIDWKMEQFRDFHTKVSGRETRGKQTWEKQADGIKKNRDFAVFQYDKETGELDGASLFTATHSHCYYSVAVYNRDKFERPIGHMAQDVAMNYLRELGIRWYIVGDRFYKSDGVDRKNLSISEYKEAFATSYYLKVCLALDLYQGKGSDS